MLTFTKTKQIKTQVQMNILIFNYYKKAQRTLHFQTNVIFWGLFQDSGFKELIHHFYFNIVIFIWFINMKKQKMIKNKKAYSKTENSIKWLKLFWYIVNYENLCYCYFKVRGGCLIYSMLHCEFIKSCLYFLLSAFYQQGKLTILKITHVKHYITKYADKILEAKTMCTKLYEDLKVLCRCRNDGALGSPGQVETCFSNRKERRRKKGRGLR